MAAPQGGRAEKSTCGQQAPKREDSVFFSHWQSFLSLPSVRIHCSRGRCGPPPALVTHHPELPQLENPHLRPQPPSQPSSFRLLTSTSNRDLPVSLLPLSIPGARHITCRAPHSTAVPKALTRTGVHSPARPRPAAQPHPGHITSILFSSLESGGNTRNLTGLFEELNEIMDVKNLDAGQSQCSLNSK